MVIQSVIKGLVLIISLVVLKSSIRMWLLPKRNGRFINRIVTRKLYVNTKKCKFCDKLMAKMIILLAPAKSDLTILLSQLYNV